MQRNLRDKVFFLLNFLQKKKKKKSTLYGWNNLFNIGTKIAKCSNYIIILSVSVNPL